MPPGLEMTSLAPDATGVTGTLSGDVAALSTVAVDQVVCTVAGAGPRTSPDPATVTLVDRGENRGLVRTCPLSG
ncbi:MAG: hypothetical protein GEV28_01745 [Actinophytocola sp.]|uniref:hypothetical protein n=1 Tax=Actinophytocola sp. TaxID=1872138 RepID=UPI0013232A32|nr:hypothetical protein [Actinophytocola sp.]MPZ79174.1 hypothetical protein [Actinophytocola sp.]